jgi:WD40 repeat protein
MSLENFHLVTKLQGHHGNINCLSFSSDGCLLSSGGQLCFITEVSIYLTSFAGDDESVRIWDVEKHTCRQILCDPAHRWGQITTVQWVTHKASGDTLYFSTGRGMVLLYQSKKPGVRNLSLRPIRHNCDPLTYMCITDSIQGDFFEAGFRRNKRRSDCP